MCRILLLIIGCLVSAICGCGLSQRQAPSDHSSILKQSKCSDLAASDVEVLASIDATGRVISVSILQESPCQEFNEAAKQAALAQQWFPAKRNGHAITSVKKYVYRFRVPTEPVPEALSREPEH